MLCQAHTKTYVHTHTESRESFMAEGLFTLSIRSRCELSGRGDKNRAGEVRKTERERRRRGQKDSARDRRRNNDLEWRRADGPERWGRRVKLVCFIVLAFDFLSSSSSLLSNRNTSPSDVITFLRHHTPVSHTRFPRTTKNTHRGGHHLSQAPKIKTVHSSITVAPKYSVSNSEKFSGLLKQPSSHCPLCSDKHIKGDSER